MHSSRSWPRRTSSGAAVPEAGDDGGRDGGDEGGRDAPDVGGWEAVPRPGCRTRGCAARGFLQTDQVGGHEAVEQLRRVEDAHARRGGDLADRALSVDLGQQQPLHGVEVDLAFAVLEHDELGDQLDRRDLPRQHPPLVEAARGLHQQVRVALLDRLARRGDAGLELELAAAPDGERVDGLFARRGPRPRRARSCRPRARSPRAADRRRGETHPSSR